MVDAKISIKKGIYTGIMSFIPTLVLLLGMSDCIVGCLPQDWVIYGSISVGTVAGIIRTIQDAIKHRDD